MFTNTASLFTTKAYTPCLFGVGGWLPLRVSGIQLRVVLQCTLWYIETPATHRRAIVTACTRSHTYTRTRTRAHTHAQTNTNTDKYILTHAHTHIRTRHPPTEDLESMIRQRQRIHVVPQKTHLPLPCDGQRHVHDPTNSGGGGSSSNKILCIRGLSV